MFGTSLEIRVGCLENHTPRSPALDGGGLTLMDIFVFIRRRDAPQYRYRYWYRRSQRVQIATNALQAAAGERAVEAAPLSRACRHSHRAGSFASILTLGADGRPPFGAPRGRKQIDGTLEPCYSLFRYCVP